MWTTLHDGPRPLNSTWRHVFFLQSTCDMSLGDMWQGGKEDTCSDMRHDFFKTSICDIGGNKWQRHMILAFPKIYMRHRNPPLPPSPHTHQRAPTWYVVITPVAVNSFLGSGFPWPHKPQGRTRTRVVLKPGKNDPLSLLDIRVLVAISIPQSSSITRFNVSQIVSPCRQGERASGHFRFSAALT